MCVALCVAVCVADCVVSCVVLWPQKPCTTAFRCVVSCVVCCAVGCAVGCAVAVRQQVDGAAAAATGAGWVAKRLAASASAAAGTGGVWSVPKRALGGQQEAEGGGCGCPLKASAGAGASVAGAAGGYGLGCSEPVRAAAGPPVVVGVGCSPAVLGPVRAAAGPPVVGRQRPAPPCSAKGGGRLSAVGAFSVLRPFLVFGRGPPAAFGLCACVSGRCRPPPCVPSLRARPCARAGLPRRRRRRGSRPCVLGSEQPRP